MITATILAIVLDVAISSGASPHVKEVTPIILIGDSKTTGISCCESTGGFRDPLTTGLSLNGYTAIYQTLARGGQTTAGMKAVIDAWLLTAMNLNQRWVLINIGTNDIPSLPGTLTSDLGYIADALHVKFPTAKVLFMRPWQRGQNTNADTFAGIVATVISTRTPWAGNGPDERVFLKGSDDGVSETTEGIHPNSTYYGLGVGTAGQWLTSMGF